MTLPAIYARVLEIRRKIETTPPACNPAPDDRSPWNLCHALLVDLEREMAKSQLGDAK